MTIHNGEAAAVITTKSAPELVKILFDCLGEPVDSYWNGSNTWFSVWSDIELEWRLHPMSGFQMPEASRPEELFELALEGELETEHYWEGLEVFSISEKQPTLEELKAHVEEKLGIRVSACGFVDHDAIGNSFESASGNFSIVTQLIQQMNS